MMTGDAQEMAALGLVALAAVWLARRLWLQARGGADAGAGCPGCGECGRAASPAAGARPAPKATPLVTLSVGRGGGGSRRPPPPPPDA
jgi:hypothetical protein